MCAGSLISPDWVLTSAFCVTEVGTYSIDAVGGDHNLLMPSLHEQIRGVDEIIRHPNYTSSDASIGGLATPISNDIALVHLKSPMQITDYVQVIPLMERSYLTGIASLRAGEPIPLAPSSLAGFCKKLRHH